MYLLKVFGQSVCESRGVVIGYDARHNSTRYVSMAPSGGLGDGLKRAGAGEKTRCHFTDFFSLDLHS